ncbi:MAG: YdcF family protein [Clostridia bacterium]|nr:YdcF family protein [Clostridia bacterium]
MTRALKALYFALGVACVAYYFVLWHASRLGLSMSLMWPALGAVFIACGILCDSPRVPRWGHLAWRTALCVAAAALLALEGLVISGMSSTAPPDMDYLIVLGARVDPDGPSPALTRRLNAVMGCIDDHPDAVVIASGGQGADEPMSEAQCIKEQLIQRGVDGDRIVLEDRSASTTQNIRFSMALMDDPADRTGIVTNNYHVWRATAIAKKVGMSNVYGIAAEYTGHTRFHYMVREAVCIVVDFLRGNL